MVPSVGLLAAPAGNLGAEPPDPDQCPRTVDAVHIHASCVLVRRWFNIACTITCYDKGQTSPVFGVGL